MTAQEKSPEIDTFQAGGGEKPTFPPSPHLTTTQTHTNKHKTIHEKINMILMMMIMQVMVDVLSCVKKPSVHIWLLVCWNTKVNERRKLLVALCNICHYLAHLEVR